MKSVLGAYHGGTARAREGVLRRSPSYMGGPFRKTCTGTCNSLKKNQKIFFGFGTDGAAEAVTAAGMGMAGGAITALTGGVVCQF